MKSHVLFKDTDIYLINFPPELTQWACIQKARMNNADFKTALLQRMSSSHTVNTNKLPKVLKSRTPVPSPPLPVPPRRRAGGRRQPLRGKPRRAGGRGPTAPPRGKTQHLGLSYPRGLARPQTDVLSLFVIAAVGPRRAVRGQGRPRPLPRPLAI